MPGIARAQLVTAPGPGTAPAVRVIELNGTERTLLAYHPAFAGGVRVALGDVNGDGVLDIVTAPGPGGGPHVRIWNGVDHSEMGGFFAYDPAFPGGVFVAAADVDGDGRADIITGAGAGGGPHVRIWSGVDFHEIGGFFAYNPAFPGGVTVAAGDVNGDGRADIITGPGPGGGPHVRIWNGVDFSEIFGFFAYDPAFPGGVNVAAGDVNGDGRADVITGAGPGGGPHVRVWNINGFAEIGGFFAYDPGFSGGVNVGVVELTGDNRVEIVTGLGPGGLPISSIWSSDLALMGSYFAFDPSLPVGVYVGSIGKSSGLRFTSANATAFTRNAAGSFTVTTAGGAATPTLTVTGALPAGVTFTDNGDRTATLAGTPTASGTFPLTFTATSGALTPVTQSFTLTVREAPAITSGNAASFNIGSVGSSFTITTTGSPAPAISVTGALPSGITFTDNDNGTGTLAGTAAAGTGGTYPLVITASNGVGSAATQNFTLSITQGAAITSANATTFVVGAAGSFTVTTAGSPTTTTITHTGVLPAGVSFTNNGNGTATLAGTPGAGTGGSYPLTISASNGVGAPAAQSFTLTVQQAPAITSAASTTFIVGTPGTFTITTTGFPTITTIGQSGTLPAGVTFTNNGDGTATIAGTPDPGTGGTYPLTFVAGNGVGVTASQNFTLTVNQAPAITSATSATFTVGVTGIFTVNATGFPTPSIARGGVALPSGVTFVDNGNGTGTLAGTPGAGTGGTYAVTFTATNTVGSTAPQAFTLTVNQAPAITSANAATFTVGQAGSFTITTTGFPAPSIGAAGALPAGVTFLDNGNGTATIAGTPDPGTGGTYPLTITATSIAGTATPQSFTLSINQPAAITSANTATFIVGSLGSFTITTSGVPTVTTITRGGVALPSGVTYVDNGDGTGTLSGTPAPGTGGAYAITFTATNGVGSPAVQTFTLNVHQVPAITSANNTTFTVGTPGTFTVTTTGFPTPTVSQTGTLPTGVTFTPATRVLAGTATQTGAFPLVFTATNSVPPDATQNVTLNVVCPAITVNAPALTTGLYQVAYPQATFTQTGSTGSSLTWSATGLPAGLAIAPTTGILSGTPTDTVLGASVAVTVTDNFGCVGNGNVAITVRPTTDNENYFGGVGNTQYAVGVAGISTPHVAVSDNVKTGDNGPGALSVVFNAPANGAVLEGATDGTFVYTPNAGFAGPTDSFTYTLTDGNGVTNTGSVTINLNSLVWYVNSASAGGDGRSHAPFNALDDAEAPSGAGSRIYVHTGGATTTGNLAMDATQTLHGQGAAFTLNSLTIPAGTRPTLTGTVTLGSGAIVQAVNFTPSGIPAMTGTGLPLGAIITQVNVTGGTNALSLTNVSGGVSVVGSTFTNASGAEVLINQGTGAVLIAAAISSNAGRSIDVQNRTGGTVEFAGLVTDTGQGVFLNANTGSTITFTGGMSLSTGANPAFTATGGGTVTSTGTNTITTTTGTALNVANTTIGAAGLTFRSIAANGAANGIVLNNTGVGTFAVTGTGGAGSGGTIQNAVQSGILLTSTSQISLSSMNIQNSGEDGIEGDSINGMTLTSLSVTNSGNDSEDVGIRVNNLWGAAAWTNLTVTGSELANALVRNTSGVLASFTISGGSYSNLGTTFGGNSILIEMTGTAVMNSGNVTGATIANNTPARGITVQAQGTIGVGSSRIGDDVSNSFTVQNCTFANNGLHASFEQSLAAELTFRFINNGTVLAPLTGSLLQAVNVFSSSKSTGGTIIGTVQNNFIGNAAVANSGSTQGGAISAVIQGQTEAILLIDGNVSRQTSGDARTIGVAFRGYDSTPGDPAPAGTVISDVTITNNDLVPGAAPSGFPLAAIMVEADNQTDDDSKAPTVRADIRGNTVPVTPVFDFFTAQIGFYEYDAAGGHGIGQLVDTPPASATATLQLQSANTGTAEAFGVALIAGPIRTPVP